MVVDPADSAVELIEADVIEPFETGPRDTFNTVVGHQEVLLPSHKQMLVLGKVFVGEVGLLRHLRQWTPRREFGPVVHISSIGSSPGLMTGLECVFRSDDFGLEECSKRGMVFREPY